MSKVLPASCVGNVVSFQGFPVAGVTVQGAGVASSEGVLIIDEENSFYLANTSPDLNTTLEKLIAVLGKVKTGLTKTASGLNKVDTAGYIKTVSGGSGAPAVGVAAAPVAASDISGINTSVSDIAAIISELETLKGGLL